ncbi:MAG: hypothetical protein OET90_08645, partial [Desulfuromonadales bacterium]|nr:hypothetical protein [Desulfuromonadales bacterium]
MLNALFQQAELPAGRILFVHARLKNLKRSTGHDYGRLTALVLEQLQKTQPKAILVPAYTIYSFMMTGVFHRQFSKSEVGRFSEEVRHSSKPHRTPDPMYSVL